MNKRSDISGPCRNRERQSARCSLSHKHSRRRRVRSHKDSIKKPGFPARPGSPGRPRWAWLTFGRRRSSRGPVARQRRQIGEQDREARIGMRSMGFGPAFAGALASNGAEPHAVDRQQPADAPVRTICLDEARSEGRIAPLARGRRREHGSAERGAQNGRPQSEETVHDLGRKRPNPFDLGDRPPDQVRDRVRLAGFRAPGVIAPAARAYGWSIPRRRPHHDTRAATLTAPAGTATATGRTIGAMGRSGRASTRPDVARSTSEIMPLPDRSMQPRQINARA